MAEMPAPGSGTMTCGSGQSAILAAVTSAAAPALGGLRDEFHAFGFRSASGDEKIARPGEARILANAADFHVGHSVKIDLWIKLRNELMEEHRDFLFPVNIGSHAGRK